MRDLDQAIALERKQGRMTGSLADEGIRSDGLIDVQRVEQFASSTAFDRQPRPACVRDLRVTFTLNPRAWGHRCGDRLSGAAGVVLRHPQAERHYLRGQKRS